MTTIEKCGSVNSDGKRAYERRRDTPAWGRIVAKGKARSLGCGDNGAVLSSRKILYLTTDIRNAPTLPRQMRPMSRAYAHMAQAAVKPAIIGMAYRQAGGFTYGIVRGKRSLVYVYL